MWQDLMIWLATGLDTRVRALRSERGDVPGWVLVTLMSAGLVIALWAVAGERLTGLFNTSMDRVLADL